MNNHIEYNIVTFFFYVCQWKSECIMKNSSTTDKLLHRLSKDDYAAFEELFRLYHKPVYLFVCQLVSSSYETEEVVQNVFIAIWSQRKKLQISTSFLSYLFGIARHFIYRFIQQKINHEAFIEYYVYQNNEYNFITEEEVLFNELREKYQRLLEDIPERRREIFKLSREEGLSYKAISEKLGISENTVDTQIRSALAFLRNHLIS